MSFVELDDAVTIEESYLVLVLYSRYFEVISIRNEPFCLIWFANCTCYFSHKHLKVVIFLTSGASDTLNMVYTFVLPRNYA